MAAGDALLRLSSTSRGATACAVQPRHVDRLALLASAIFILLLGLDWVHNAWPEILDYDGAFGDCLDIAYFIGLMVAVVALVRTHSRLATLNVVAVLFIVNLKHFMFAVENLLDKLFV